MKFSEACISAINLARQHGWAFYVHDSPSLWDVTSVYRPGWLFKAYPGGRKIVSPAGKRILDSESRPTLREADDLSVCLCPSDGMPNAFCPLHGAVASGHGLR